MVKLATLQQEMRDLEWGGGAVGEAVDSLRQDVNTLRQAWDYSRATETKQQERLLEIENKVNQINLMLRRVSNQIQDLGRTVTASNKAVALNTSLLLTLMEAKPREPCPSPPPPAPPLMSNLTSGQPRDCWDILRQGNNHSGVHLIQPSPYHQPFLALCDMETLGGGWTVFQMREDGSTDFMRTWREFEKGFGNLATKEFWLGLEKLHLITNARMNDLLVTLRDHAGDSAWAYYQQFAVGDSRQDYSITSLGNYHGTAGDSLSGHVFKFSAPDRDNDMNDGVSCGRSGAWWHRDCEDQDSPISNLNGLYLNGSLPQVFPAQGMLWTSWRGLSYSIPHSAMMVRPSADVYTHATSTNAPLKP
ncbi:ficolin-2-like [Macrosteles quadrilineatus]|uniref:ficolin-2-like n=1 Tax=Macrosteles quadrilineatus TaxID=74068 RepID=UPI0023E29A0A|nr:ficolin-2-like [Macrosteles quadrilineatus]